MELKQKVAKRSQLDSLSSPGEHDVEFIQLGKAMFLLFQFNSVYVIYV